MANLISSLRAGCYETQLLIDLCLSTFEALQLALPLSSTYFIYNNLMIQLKHYQIRNTIYILAFDLFRNQVERELVVKGKRTGKKRSQHVVFQTRPLPCPYGQCRQGGAGSYSELTGIAELSMWENTVGCQKD